MNQDLPIYPILLAGGSGTRLWPVSRSLYPKQLVKFLGKRSLLQETIKRLDPVLDIEKIRIVCGRQHQLETADHLHEIGLAPEDKIFSEPVGKNTAPAVLLSVMKMLESEAIRDAIFFIFPADHVIQKKERFHVHVKRAAELAARGFIVTFGIQPDYPETGYGYIEGNDPVHDGALTIQRFVEKPDAVTAEGYIAAGNFFWNSGMFAFKASVILGEFSRFQPDMLKSMAAIMKKPGPIQSKDYGRLSNISFDYAIMEKTTKGVVLPSDFGWSDIGSWKSLYTFLEKDKNDNVIDGDIIVRNTEKCLIMGSGRLIAANGLAETVVVETPDSVFVSDMEGSRDVKEIVAVLEQKQRKERLRHGSENHSWGRMTYLEETPFLSVAKLTIKPDAAFRTMPVEDQHWSVVILSGKALVTHEKEDLPLQIGESLSIKANRSVKLSNIGPQDLSAIIIQQAIKKEDGKA